MARFALIFEFAEAAGICPVNETTERVPETTGQENAKRMATPAPRRSPFQCLEVREALH